MMILDTVGDQLDRRDEWLVGCLCHGTQFLKWPDRMVAWICFLHPDSPGIVYVGGGNGRLLAY